MRQNDPDTAKWIAQSFGESEIGEMQHGLSYGASELRDGENLSRQRKKVEILLPSQISSLNNLEGYIRLPGDVPVAHFKMQHIPIPTRAEAFEPRPMELESDRSEAEPRPNPSGKMDEISHENNEEAPTGAADEPVLFGNFDNG